MHTADYVDRKIQAWIDGGKVKAEIVWDAAKLCVGWPYVYSAWGDYCTPSERRKRYRMCPGHETIKTKCKGFDSGNCDGCAWYPDKKRVRCFDCRGFTDWCLKQVGIDLYGDTCSTQWNHKENWAAKGEIATMPKDRLCCLFVYDGKWKHTGFGYGDETCECSSGVEYYKVRKAKWTHWAVPAGLYEGKIDPEPMPEYPTLRPGNKNIYVKLMQEMLLDRGYDLGICGADGDYGTATEKAVKQFQKDWGLTQDGICGPKTWEMLRTSPVKEKLYAVTIPNLDLTQAKAICNNYPGSTYRQM